MELLRCKARLSVLWIAMAAGTVSAMFLSFLAPGTMEEVIAGEYGGMKISEGFLSIYSLFFIIPLLMAILCLNLKRSANRWLNFILGIIWVLWFISELVSHLLMIEGVPIAMWLMLIFGFIFSVYIVYCAWRLPEQEA